MQQRQAVLRGIRLCGKRHQTVQQWSYKIIFKNKWITAFLQEKGKKPPADCSIWQSHAILLNSHSSGANMCLLSGITTKMPGSHHTAFHMASPSCINLTRLIQKAGYRSCLSLIPRLPSLQQREPGFMGLHLYILNPSPPLP